MTNAPRFDRNQAETLIKGIVQAIPGASLYKDADGHCRGFTLPGDRKVYFNYDSQHHRLSVNGAWPTSRITGSVTQFGPWDLHPRPDDTSITISCHKTADKIAAEVQRRFMPAYEAVFQLCAARRQRHEDYANGQYNTACKVAALLDIAPPGESTRASQTVLFYLPDNIVKGEGSIEVSGNDVSIKLRSLSLEKAARVIAFLKTL